jgi:hypothetical protein
MKILAENKIKPSIPTEVGIQYLSFWIPFFNGMVVRVRV